MKKLIYLPAIGYYIAFVLHYFRGSNIVRDMGFDKIINWGIYQIICNVIIGMMILYLSSGG
jgi:hypothetical protein